VTARETRDDSVFHLWRRRTKDHWYQMRMLDGLSKTARARARRAVEADPKRFGDARTIAVVLGCLEKSRLGLRKRSLKLGARLFVRPPGKFLPAVEGWLSP
jgi:hypothetical protein